MTAVPIRALHPYEVCIAPGLLSDLGPRAAALLPPRQAMLVSDDRVYPLYGPAAEASLTRAGFRVSRFVFPHGEKSKSLPTYTALLAAVDSSVGGKTAVNLPGGKNQVGAFHQPALVLCDPSLLETLPPAEYQNGCAEIIKCALLQSQSLFRAIAERPVSRQWESVIAACVEIKGDFIQSDEFDTGRRRLCLSAWPPPPGPPAAGDSAPRRPFPLWKISWPPTACPPPPTIRPRPWPPPPWPIKSAGAIPCPWCCRRPLGAAVWSRFP